jgi:iron(III) transport system permease protein
MGEISYSMGLAFLASFLMVVLSFFVSYFIERSRGWSSILDYSSLIPFALPATVLGIGLIRLWNQPFTQVIYGSSLIVLIAYVAHFVPFTIRIILSDLKKIAVDLEEVAFLTTTRWFCVIKKIVVPLARPGFLTAFFIGFVLCFGDLSTTLLTIPPGRETVPIKIYNYMHYGAEHLVAALCVIIVSITLIMGGLFYLCYRKWLRYD